jgi:Alpha-L-fucosidase
MKVGLCMLLALAGGLSMTTYANWHEDAFFGLHYDLHPGETDTELGRETTYEHIREQLEKVKPDFVQYDCKGHPGWTGYPTDVGSPSPGIVNDALKVWREVTRDMGIPLSIHYSGVWDSRAIQLHPEWANIDAAGKPSPNNTCPLSAYIDELLIPQLLEVVENYDIDGMWIDGENWASRPCYCERCTAEFTKRTGIAEVPRKKEDPNWAQWLAFHRTLFEQHVTKYAEAVHAKKPTCLVCSNWMYSVRQPDPVQAPVDYLSGDFDPSFGGYRACAEARFISSRGMPWDLMAWAFLKAGDQGWTMKTAPHLCQEVSEVLAQGGAVFLYNQPQRSGRLTAWHQDLYAEVAAFCRQRQEYCHGTETIPQVAILHSQSYYYRHNDPLFNFGPANQAMEGALHAVLENGYSADILNEEALCERAAQYPIVVVPEQEGLPQPVMDALDAYVKAGGRLLISGGHVAAQCGALAGVAVAEGYHGSAYVPADNGCVIVSGAWQNTTLNGAEELAPLLNQQEPELNKAGTSAATCNRVGEGVVVAVHGPVFRAYHEAHYPRVRRFIGDMLDALDAPSVMRMHGPWWIEMAARRKDGRRLVQFVNRASSGHLTPNRHMVEHVPDAGAFTVTIPMDQRPTRCYMAPDQTGLEWTWSDGVLTAEIVGLGIHNVLVVE